MRERWGYRAVLAHRPRGYPGRQRAPGQRRCVCSSKLADSPSSCMCRRECRPRRSWMDSIWNEPDTLRPRETIECLENRTHHIKYAHFNIFFHVDRAVSVRSDANPLQKFIPPCNLEITSRFWYGCVALLPLYYVCYTYTSHILSMG
jgi:hypothetical protein